MLKRWLPSILLCFSLFSSADQTTNLYRVLVPVGDQSAKSRDSGIDQAFSSMLIKLSGDSQIMQSPLLQPFLTDPKAFLDSVGFSQVDTASLDSQNAMALDVKFDRKFVDKLLKQAQVPIVSPQRPNFLVWLMVDDLNHYNIKEEGAKIRYSDLYGTSGSNVNFVAQLNKDTFSVRTYERGVEDETLSCGTGVTACALAYMVKKEQFQSEIIINTKGAINTNRIVVIFAI